MKRPLVILAALMLVLAMAGAASGGTVTVKAGASGSTFSPKSKSVAKGTKVVWMNAGSATHTITSYGGDWSKNKTVAPGSSTSFTFTKPGTYKYRCTIHSSVSGGVCSGMCGKIVIG